MQPALRQLEGELCMLSGYSLCSNFQVFFLPSWHFSLHLFFCGSAAGVSGPGQDTWACICNYQAFYSAVSAAGKRKSASVPIPELLGKERITLAWVRCLPWTMSSGQGPAILCIVAHLVIVVCEGRFQKSWKGSDRQYKAQQCVYLPHLYSRD